MRISRIAATAVAAMALIATIAVGGAAAGSGHTRAYDVGSHDHAVVTTDEHGSHTGDADAARATQTRRAFRDAMRKLWEDHVTWTRLFIVSFAHDLPDLQATTHRLLRNQVDIGDAVKPFYGRAGGDALTELLTEHITTAADVLAAAKTGDDEAFDAARRAWYRNGRQIARFLHDANPEHWGLSDMRSMMREHLDLTLAEAAHRLAGDYEADVEDYEAVHVAILHMADMLSRGIIRQFPGRFA